MTEYIVYCRTDEREVIVAINSSAFVDGEGWTEIDRGCGDRYAHAQGHYLHGDLMDDDGVYNYKLVAGAMTERTEEEKDVDRAAIPAVYAPTGEERVTDLEAAFEVLMSGEVASE